MRPINKPLYTQFYDSTINSFVEQKLTGISFEFTTGDFNSLIYGDRTFYSGLRIPIFKNDRIIAYPVIIGNSQTVDGPAINIGSYNLTWSPSIIRKYAWGPEIALGSSNLLLSGVGNVAIGHFNDFNRTQRMHMLGTYNYATQSIYSSVIGTYNQLSGFSESTVLGKNNYLYAKNNVEGLLSAPGVSVSTFSGYENYKVAVIGDNNSLFEGAGEVTLLGNYNQFTQSSGISCYGNANNFFETYGGNTYVIGFSNDINKSFNIYSIGDSNIFESANSDTVIGKLNYSTGSYMNYVFGGANSLEKSSNNIIYGNSNTILSSTNNSVFGSINTLGSGDENTIFGNNNVVSGANDNFIFGSQNSSDAALRTELANGHAFLTDRLNASAGSSNYYMGQLVRGTDNYSTHSLGVNNKLAGNSESLLVGRDNEFVLNTKSFAFGYNNRITGSRDSIFVGFNFISGTSSQGISGVGIKISPSGIDIYGTLRVNGVRLNIP